MKHCSAKADWNFSNFGDTSLRDETFERIPDLRFLNSFSSSKSESGQTFISFSNKGNLIRSKMIFKGSCNVLSVGVCRCFRSKLSCFNILVAASAMSLGLTYVLLSSSEIITS